VTDIDSRVEDDPCARSATGRSSRWLVVRIATLLLGLACLGYFVRELWSRWPDVRRLTLSVDVGWALGAAIVIHLAITAIDASSWGWLMGRLGVRTSTRAAIGVFFVSQFAKYLPGNVGQHIGRVTLGHGEGMQAGRTVLSLLFENAVAIGAGAALASAAATLAALDPVDASHVVPLSALIGIALVTGTLGLRHLLSRPPPLVRRALTLDGPLELDPKFLLGYLGSHVLSYGAMATALGLLLHETSGGTALDASRVLLAATAGWLTGFLVPGAPAGLGPREVAVTAILLPTSSSETVVAAVLLWRLSSMVGDGLALALGLWIRRGARPARG
jgi:uncharacterized membrane protein YbhN (UPF0104 family)